MTVWNKAIVDPNRKGNELLLYRYEKLAENWPKSYYEADEEKPASSQLIFMFSTYIFFER